MFGMPVEWKAVETSPQGMPIPRAGPAPKSKCRSRLPAGRLRITPPRRTLSPSPIASTIVFAVPRDTPPPSPAMAIRSSRASVSRLPT